MSRTSMILFASTLFVTGCSGGLSEPPPGQTEPPDGAETNADICESTDFCCIDDGYCDVDECPEPDPDCEFCGFQDDICVLLCPELDPDCTNNDFCEGLEQCCSDDSVCEGDCPEPDLDCEVNSAEDIQNATWLVLWVNSNSSGLATAFGVGPDMLATNAHVTEGIKASFEAQSDTLAWVFQHETGDRRTITAVWSHPDYNSDAQPTTVPDLGLLKVAEEIPSYLTFADVDILQALEVFDEVSLCGFPGSVVEGIDINVDDISEFRPRATCLQGTLSALRPFDPSDATTPENTFIIQYDLPTVGGTSGSAVFDSRGEVIGVNFAGFTSGGDFNFAIRSDKLAELMVWADQGQVPGVILSDIEPQNDSDSDGIPDTLDGCPDDPNKSEPGECGCGTPEDSDGDGYNDCNDEDGCPSDPSKYEPGICGCGFVDAEGCGGLLATPLDGVIVLADLSVWSVFSGDEFTVSGWLVGDRVTVSESFGSSNELTNIRTSETVSAFFKGIGIRLTIVGFQDQEFGSRLISFDDGTTWDIYYSDENESRTWQVGDAVVLFESYSTDKAINLRTGRVISLW